MELTIDIEELRKRRLFLATPMYGGNCFGGFAKSCMDLAAICSANGIHLETHFMFNESLITRGRAYCADAFMRSSCTHMMFVDSDIGFNAQDIIMMLAMMSDDSQYDILCGPYAKKTIAFEKIKAAVDAGFADEDPQALEAFVGDYVFNMVPGSDGFNLNDPVEVLESGTGFMMIRRKTFELFDQHYPEKRYRPDHVRTAEFDGSREITMYFDCIIDPETKRYLSEDYYFCQQIRKAGGKVWLCPWQKLSHQGTYMFGQHGLEGIARLGASPTADSSVLGKQKAIK